MISISVETTAKEVKDATDKNAEISNAVVDKLKSLLNEKKGESIETTEYNVAPQYTYKDGRSNLTGYKVSNTVKVKMRDMQSISALIEEAVNAGATRVSGLQFGFDEENTICNELYAKATKTAYGIDLDQKNINSYKINKTTLQVGMWFCCYFLVVITPLP